MKKIIALSMMALFLCAAGFSQENTKSYLSNEIISHFIESYDVLDMNMQNIDEESWELYFDQLDEIDITGSIQQFETIEVPEQMRQAFFDAGLGENGLVVYFSLFKGMSSLYAQNIIDEAKQYWADVGYDPVYDFDEWVSLASFIVFNNKTIYPADFAVIYENREKLETLFENREISYNMETLIEEYFLSHYN